MDKSQSVDAELMQALVVEMIREGLIPRQVMERIQRTFEEKRQADVDGDHSVRYDSLARKALSILREAEGPTNSDFRASQRRQQMHSVPDSPTEDKE